MCTAREKAWSAEDAREGNTVLVALGRVDFGACDVLSLVSITNDSMLAAYSTSLSPRAAAIAT